MSIVRDFVTFMEDYSLGVFGDDIFVGGVPLNAPDSAWWVTSSGGNSAIKSVDGGKVKEYRLNVYYRGIGEDNVYSTLQDFEDLINTGACYEIGAYETVEVEATVFPVDQDLDIEERSVGLVEVTIRVYVA